MRLLRTSIVLITSILCFLACEDVVDIETPSDRPRFIFDALIRVDTTQAMTPVRVEVTETNNFFEAIPPASVAEMMLQNEMTGEQIFLTEVPENSGIYIDTIPTEFLLRDRLSLQITTANESYVASASFQPSVPIDSLVVGDGVLIEDETELIVSFTDNGSRDDYYLFDFDFSSYLVTEDEFYQGQPFTFSYFYNEELAIGRKLEISLMGVDKPFYDYMALLIEQSEPPFGPFETPSVTVRGNFITVPEGTSVDNANPIENPDAYALGYFAIVQEYKRSIFITE